MAARSKKKNLFGMRKALAARQTTPASGGVAKHARRATAGKSETVGSYGGHRIWKDAQGEYRFSGDPDSAFATLREVKSMIDWLKKGRNPKKRGLTDQAADLVARSAGLLPPKLNPETVVVESEIPVFRSGLKGFPGIDYLISYPELNQAIAYAQAVKGAYPQVGVVCLEESESKLPGGDYAVVLDAEAVRAVEAAQVGSAQNPRGLWPMPYEIDGAITAKAAELALRNRQASKQTVDSTASDLIHHLYGRNAVVDAATLDHVHSVLAGTYDSYRHSRKAELEKTIAQYGKYLNNPRRKNHVAESHDSEHMTIRLKQASIPRGGYLSSWSGWQYFPSISEAYVYLVSLQDQAKEKAVRFSVRIERKSAQGWQPYGKSIIVKPPSKTNPEADAAAMFEAFHGRPSDRILEITEEIHEHEYLAELGTLVSFAIETPTGLRAELEFTSDAPKLASNEEGSQLFVVAGKQSVNLKPLKMDGDWRKESMVLGWIWVLTYNTEKDFDKFESIDYYHKLSEEERGSVEKRRKTLPVLRYDTVNEKLHIDGGKYRIKKPLIGTSPGIEN